MATFLGAPAWLGFGQPANNSAAAAYKTNCVSCHGQDGRGSPVGKSLHIADFHSAQVQQQSDAQLAGLVAEGRGDMPAIVLGVVIRSWWKGIGATPLQTGACVNMNLV
jgi:mono/diheme cytochrome c family protein